MTGKFGNKFPVSYVTVV